MVSKRLEITPVV